jgi:hypothetical protein
MNSETNKNHLYFLVAAHAAVFLFFIVLTFFINKIPGDKMVAQGDFFQGIDNIKNTSSYLFTWFNNSGQGSYNPLIVSYPYYLFQGVLEKIGLQSGQVADLQIFLFLYLSFLSFYVSLRILGKTFYKNFSSITSFGGALFYALNIFTFEILSYSYGYLHFFLIYIFIPILFVLFLRCILQPSIKQYAVYVPVFLLATISFNNVAFLASLFLFQFLFVSVFWLFKRKLKIIFDYLILVTIQTLLSLYFLLPFLFSEIAYTSKLKDTQSFGGNVINNIVQQTSSTLINVLRFNTQSYHFPGINLYATNFLGNIIPLTIGFLPIILIVTLLLNKSWKHKKQGSENIILFSLLINLLIYIILVVRISAPFEGISRFLFNLPGFLIFRSPEKIFLIYNYIIVLLTTFALDYLLSNKWRYFIIALLLLIPFPFYIGGITKYMETGFSSDLQTPLTDGYKDLVTIPHPYLDIQSEINKDPNQESIISLPYAVVNSLNWSNYPMWNFVGADFLHLLYNKFYISANTYDHPDLETELSFKEFNDAKEDPAMLLSLIQKFSGKFVIYHKDIDPSWIEQDKYTETALQKLVVGGYLNKDTSNTYFDLYTINENYFVPLIHLNENSSSTVTFLKISPVEYKLNLHLVGDDTLTFNQSFNDQWKIYQTNKQFACGSSFIYPKYGSIECPSSGADLDIANLSLIFTKPIFSSTHAIINDYANSWQLNRADLKKISGERTNPDGSVDISLELLFLPQSYFYLGLIISGTTLLACLGYLGWDFSRRKKKKLAIDATTNKEYV